MGWFDDAVSTVTNTVSNVVSGVSSGGQSVLSGTGNTLKGLGNNAVDVGKKVVGTSQRIPFWWAETGEAQRILRDKGVAQATFGYSEDFADHSRASQALSEGREVKNSEWQGSGRFLVKTAAVAGGVKGGLTATNYAVGQVGYGQLQRGNVAGAAAAIGTGGILNQYLPDTPGFDPGNFLVNLLPSGEQPSQPTFSDPGFSNYYPETVENPYQETLTYSGAPTKASVSPAIAIGGVLLVAFILARRM